MAPPPLGPMRESVGIRQVFANGVLQAAAMAMDLVGINVTTEKGTDGVLRYKVDIPGSNFQTLLEARVSAIEPYAVPGGKWDVLPVVTSNTALSIGQLAPVDMTGKAAPDVVELTLPLASGSNVGRAIGCSTVNSGGAEDGAKVRVATQGGQLVKPPGAAAVDYVNEMSKTFVSDGTGWIVSSM